jgi:hypothetical protein
MKMQRYLKLLLCIPLISGEALSAENGMIPDRIMPKVAWSFAEPTPKSADELAERIVQYGLAIKRRVDRRELQRAFPDGKLDVIYQYFTVGSGGSLKPMERVIRIRNTGKSLTFGQILFELQKSLHDYAKSDDHKYFEGLYRSTRTIEHGIPLYELHIGS